MKSIRKPQKTINLAGLSTLTRKTNNFQTENHSQYLMGQMSTKKSEFASKISANLLARIHQQLWRVFQPNKRAKTKDFYQPTNPSKRIIESISTTKSLWRKLN